MPTSVWQNHKDTFIDIQIGSTNYFPAHQSKENKFIKGFFHVKYFT